MDDDELFKFYVRSLLQANVYFLRQLPLRLNARINANTFLSSFTKAKHTDRTANCSGNINERTDAGTWLYAPTGYTQHPDAPDEDPAMSAVDRQCQVLRDEVRDEWIEGQRRNIKFMPSECNRKLDNLMDISETRRGREAKSTGAD